MNSDKQFDSKNIKLHFLVHLNRSGSTFLAKLLDEYTKIGVSIESSFPDGIIRKSIVINSEDEVPEKIKILYTEKFKKWGINPDSLQREIKSNNVFPLKFNELFMIILKMYFRKEKPDSNTFIFKTSWEYLYFFKIVSRLFPGSKIIFIIRDGRAIYNSQKKSLSSLVNKVMADNPYRIAKLYNRVCKSLNNNIGRQIYVLRYEDLINNKSSEIISVLDFLDVHSREKTDKSEYFNRIPEEQHHLHNNLTKAPIRERISAWKSELSLEEIYVFQKKAGQALKHFDYDLIKTDISKIYGFFIYMKFFLYFLLKGTIDKIAGLFNYTVFKSKVLIIFNKRKT